MSAARDTLRRVVVAGGGQVAVLAAIGVKRALPGCDVTVLGQPSDPAAFADRAASALPFAHRLHDRLGISEERIVARAAGSHRLVTRYIGWGGRLADGSLQHGAVPYGAPADPAMQSRFARDWGRGPRNESAARPPGSLAEVLCDAGRFLVSPPDRQTPLSGIDYALRWNPHAYGGLLIDMAQALGIGHRQGAIGWIEADANGGIAALSMQGGERLEADLFIDCTGTASSLIGALPGHSWLDWGAHLPVRRILLARPGEAMLALEDRIGLLDEGWLCEFAGRDGLQVTLGLAEGVSHGEAERALGGEALAEIAVSPGRASQAWLGNVVAIGDAAAQFDPLGFFHLDLAHRQIDLLLEMLPGRDIEPLERAEYNRRAGMMADRVRDTLAAHYAAPRAAEVFGPSEIPSPLAAALDQYTRRGRLPFREEAPLVAEEHMALLDALGFPAGIRPQSLSTDARAIEEARRAFDRQARAALEFAPPYAAWMQSVLQSGGASPIS